MIPRHDHGMFPGEIWKGQNPCVLFECVGGDSKVCLALEDRCCYVARIELAEIEAHLGIRAAELRDELGKYIAGLCMRGGNR